MGAGGEDVQLSPAARKLIPYQIECKAKNRAQVFTWYEQAKTHGKHEPIVVVKQDRKKPLVIVDAEHFFKLLVTIQQLTDSKLLTSSTDGLSTKEISNRDTSKDA
jgi:hypothetical protein